MTALAQFEKEAIAFAATLAAGDIVLLNGEMGAGKTTFVSALARYFDFQDVSSPSFALVNHYAARIPLIHMDLYRCETEESVKMLDLDHYFDKKDHIILIEWAQRAPWLEQQCSHVISIEVTAEFTRHVTIQKHR